MNDTTAKNFNEQTFFVTPRESGYFRSKDVEDKKYPLGCFFKSSDLLKSTIKHLEFTISPLIKSIEDGISSHFKNVQPSYLLTALGKEFKSTNLQDVLVELRKWYADTKETKIIAFITIYCVQEKDDDIEFWKTRVRIYSFEESWDSTEEAFPVYGIGVDKTLIPLESTVNAHQERLFVDGVLFRLMSDYDSVYSIV